MLFRSLLWNKSTSAKIPVCIGCDVGGSGIRVRISSFIDNKKTIDLPHAKAKSTSDLLGILNKIKKATDKTPIEFKGASMAIAGPIQKDRVILTNWPGPISQRTLKISDLPKEVFPVGKCALLNDLEAGAYGIVAAKEMKILDGYFEQMWTHRAPKGPIVSDTRTAVLALGSGLGVGLIVNSPMIDRPLVLPTELGHLQIPIVGKKHQNYKYEKKLFNYISDHYYKGMDTLEYEDIASGRGLALSYQYIYHKNTGKMLPLETLEGGEIAAAAKGGDKNAREAMILNIKILLRASKAVATSLSCNSVILALDNQVKNNYIMHENSKELEDEFYQFIRPDWMNGIRVYTQTKVLNFNLLGTDYMAHRFALK